MMVAILAMASLLVIIPTDDGSLDATQFDVIGGKTLFKTGEVLEADDEDGIYIISFKSESGSPFYAARSSIVDRNGNSVSSGSVSPANYYYSSSDDGRKGIKVTMPSTAGKYMLKTEFEITSGGEKYTRYYPLTVVEPIILTAEIVNKGSIEITLESVAFVIDGKEMDVTDENKNIIVPANGSKTVTYEWIVDSPSGGSHSFKLNAKPDGIKDVDLEGLNKKYTFYVGENDHTLITVIFGIILIILLLVVIWIARKPVKNFGKPKGRR